MKNKQKKAQKSYLYIIFLALAFIILLGTGAYAYYQTTISGTISGTVAQWSFKANNQTSAFNLDFGQLYPGKYAEYSIELSAEDSDLPVGFLLMFNSPSRYNADNIEIAFSPELAVLYSNFFAFEYFRDIRNDALQISNPLAGLYGIIFPGAKITIPLYYDWPYELDSPLDDYNRISDIQNITAPITIIGRQLNMASEDALSSSLEQFMDDHLISLSCTNGTYPYPNKYGYHCEEQPLVIGDISSGISQEGGQIAVIFDNW